MTHRGRKGQAGSPKPQRAQRCRVQTDVILRVLGSKIFRYQRASSSVNNRLFVPGAGDKGWVGMCIFEASSDSGIVDTTWAWRPLRLGDPVRVGICVPGT